MLRSGRFRRRSARPRPAPSAGAWILALLPLAQASAERPNVLVIVADDLGADHLTLYGGREGLPVTPNLEALAANGVVFEHAWANPICSPTRATLMTGRYAFRYGVGRVVRADTTPLPLDEQTLPERLRAAGYASGAFGKWHLGNALVGGDLGPNLAGFDHFAGTLAGLDNYFLWQKVVDGDREVATNYATSEAVDDLLAWAGGAPEPWFGWLAFHSPHSPYHRPPRALHSTDFSAGDDDRLRFKAMIEAMDSEIGRMLAALEGSQRPLLVVFVGDNGTSQRVLPEGWPARQSKNHLFQGGVRVPLIVSGPMVAAPGRRSRGIVNTVDVFATVAEAAGATEGPENDAVSLWGALTSRTRPQRRFALAETFLTEPSGRRVFDAVAVCDGRYKLIRSRNFDSHPDGFQMFDLARDPLESHDLLRNDLGLGDPPGAPAGRAAARAHHRLLKALTKLRR